MKRVVQTQEFTKCLRELVKKGKKGKDAIRKSRAAMAEAASEGEIKDFSRTKHGESRLPDVEKFDLGDGYRLVTQIVHDTRAFLFVGDHEDAEHWLERHKDHKWVKRSGDNTLDFVQVSVTHTAEMKYVEPNLSLPPAALELPLLDDLTHSEWKQTGFSPALISYLQSITVSRWEQDCAGIIAHVQSLANEDIAFFVYDLLDHAHRGERAKIDMRLDVAQNRAQIATEPEVSNAMRNVVNSEKFVTWQEAEFIPENSSWADWLLFLHSEQKEIVSKDFNGPARLRGVSGSGKTCVLVHRARSLVRRYPKEIVLALSLTESTRKLLDYLADELCGVERTYLKTSTMFSLASEFIDRLAPNGLNTFGKATPNIKFNALAAAEQAMLNSAKDLGLTNFQGGRQERMKFLRDEIDYIRTRLLPSEYDVYLKMKRAGRVVPLPETARPPILSALNAYDAYFRDRNVRDPESTLQYALELATNVQGGIVSDCRCILVDEVQDLSQVEMRLLAQLIDRQGRKLTSLSDGVFLCGDGAQSIYKRGFSLKHSGISVANRSYVLKKNYRNTKEILAAAFGLISSYEFADVDEDQICSPTPPDFSVRRGSRPCIVKCRSQSDETDFVVAEILRMKEDFRAMNDDDGSDDIPELPICVIGFNQADRDRISSGLEAAGLQSSVLKDDIKWSSPSVKISTVESAKGHEFQAVFIIGLCQGAMPHADELESEWKREAARLYVAMTRARDVLYLSYSREGSSMPSKFLTGLLPNCSQMEFRNGALRPLPYSELDT